MCNAYTRVEEKEGAEEEVSGEVFKTREEVVIVVADNRTADDFINCSFIANLNSG